MKEIKLTKGQVALVDDEDFDYLNQFKWCCQVGRCTNYAKRTQHTYINGKDTPKAIWMHRLIMNPPSHLCIDHINKNGLDNQKENLRIVTYRENLWNMICQAKAIGTIKIDNKYASVICINGKDKYLGYYETIEQAHNAYMNEAKTLIEIEKNKKP